MEAPEHLQKFLAERGGRNLYGGPLYRLVWSNDRLCWKYGEWTDHDASGNEIRKVVEARETPKYAFAKNRWILESWHPADYYGTPATWAREMTDWRLGTTCSVLGEYPSRGDYELLDVIEKVGTCECGSDVNKPCPTCHKMTSYIEPTEAYLESILAMLARAKARARMDIGIAVRDIEERDRARMIEYYYHRLKNDFRAFNGTKHASLAGLELPSGLVVPN